MKFHCMFEQSGTFKREFQKLGYEAFDYDILNDYGETDYQVDLFKEIQNANQGKPSVFDNISKDDVIIAFYPCIRFEDQILMGFRGDLPQQINWDDEKKLEYDIQLHNELHELYTILCTLCLICLRGGGYKLIIENPYSAQHYLQRYFALKPALIDKDRTFRGDFYRKPTQYWFLGMDPKNNLLLEPRVIHRKRDVVRTVNSTGTGGKRKLNRSEISPDYARRFIREFIIEGET